MRGGTAKADRQSGGFRHPTCLSCEAASISRDCSLARLGCERRQGTIGVADQVKKGFVALLRETGCAGCAAMARWAGPWLLVCGLALGQAGPPGQSVPPASPTTGGAAPAVTKAPQASKGAIPE